MILGNIVTNKNIEKDERFIYYNSSEEIIDKSLPILYVGYDLVKELGFKVDTTCRKISDNVFWTFNKNESNKYFVKDLYDFIIYSHYNKIKPTIYTFINPFKSYSDLKRILNFINRYNNYKTVITDTNMIYFSSDHLIFGFDLNFAKFCNVDIVKLINKIKKKSIIFTYKSDVSDNVKLFVELMDDDKYLPFLL